MVINDNFYKHIPQVLVLSNDNFVVCYAKSLQYYLSCQHFSSTGALIGAEVTTTDFKPLQQIRLRLLESDKFVVHALVGSYLNTVIYHQSTRAQLARVR